MKYLLTALLILLLPVQAFAMERPVFGVIFVSVPGGANRFFPFDSGSLSSPQTTAALAGTPIAVPGTISNLHVTLSAAPGAGTAYTFTLVKNGVATALTVTVSNTATVATPDNTDVVTVAAGDLLTWESIPTNAPASVPLNLSASFTGTNAGESSIVGGSSAVANTAVFWPSFGNAPRAAEADAEVVAPTSFTLDHLYYAVSGNVGAGNTDTLTLYKNGVATALTTSVSGASQTANNDLTHSVSFVAGDTLSLGLTVAGTPTSRTQHWGVRVTPTIDGEFPIFTQGTTALTTSSTRFLAGFGSSGNVGTELSLYVAPIAFTVKKANWTILPTPGSGKTWTMFSRQNSGNGNLTGQITNGNTNITDSVNSDSLVENDTFDWTAVPAGTPTATTYVNFSAVSFINPGTPTVTHGFVSLQKGLVRLLNGMLIIY